MDGTATLRGSSSNVILRLLAVQLAFGAVLSVVLWGLYGRTQGYSAMLGSLICVVPNAFLALRIAVPRRDPGVRALYRAAYIGEIGKLALTALLFGGVFAGVRPLAAPALFAGFILTQLVVVAGLWLSDE